MFVAQKMTREQGRERGQISCPTSLPNVSVCLAYKEAAWKEKILNFYCPQSFSGGGLYLNVNGYYEACMMGYYEACIVDY